MLAAGIIVFREVLEAALIVGIVLAASRGVPGRGLVVGTGGAVGALGALLVASFAGAITGAASGFGQEILNAAILLVAVTMLGWHNVWMARSGREMASDMRLVGDAVRAGTRPIVTLGVVVAAAVLREGSETVLFLYGIALAENHGLATMAVSAAIGLALGCGVGTVVYFGLVSIPMRHLFAITSLIVVLLASGLAANAAGLLASAGLLPTLGEEIWDTSSWLSEQSLIGQILHTLIGYIERPSGVQLLFYAATGGTIALLMRRSGAKATAIERTVV